MQYGSVNIQRWDGGGGGGLGGVGVCLSRETLLF